MLLQVVLSSFLIMAVSAVDRAAHGKVSGTLSQARMFPPNTELTDFAANDVLTGMQYAAGRLAVHFDGYYFVYAQAWFEPFVSDPWYNRVAICINGAPIVLIQHGMDGRAAAGSLFSGDVVELREGDYISIKTIYQSFMWVSNRHSFFGAYKIN